MLESDLKATNIAKEKAEVDKRLHLSYRRMLRAASKEVPSLQGQSKAALEAAHTCTMALGPRALTGVLRTIEL
jgi:hypothetical protein